jgi:hypothetical protein
MRQLLIGAETPVAVSYTNGLLANGAVDVQKKDSNGEITPLLPGDTVADAKEIRIVQGTASENIVSPWIAGKNIIGWDGRSYNAPVAATGTVAVTGTAGSAGVLSVKFIRTDIQPQEFYKFDYAVVNSDSNTTQATGIHDAFEALTDIPGWLNPLATVSSSTVTFVGAKNGDTTQNGETWEYGSVTFDIVVEESTPVTTSTYAAVGHVVDPVQGTGDGYDLKKFEESLRGSNFGFYNRLKLPNTPATYSATSGTYDMYSIVATKDGSTSPQIKGVDNLIEIYVAIEVDTAAITSAFQGQLNPYMNAQGFANITL